MPFIMIDIFNSLTGCFDVPELPFSMSANISVHIVHTKPSPEPVKPCLLCVRGQGKFKIPDSFKVRTFI